MDMIGYDSYFQHEPSRNAEIPLNTPENKREIPCEDSCPNYAKCAAGNLECAAFRNWASRGDFRDSDVGRLLRVCKI